MAIERPLADLVRERAAALASYNAWERQQAAQDDRSGADLAARLTWLEEAYDLAKNLGALRQFPADQDELARMYAGVGIMYDRLSLLDVNEYLYKHKPRPSKRKKREPEM